MKYLKATLLGSGALASLLLSSVLTSCQDEDFGYTTQEIRDSVYAKNFEKMYGKISKDQIWDFSTYNLQKLGLEGGPSADFNQSGLTRSADNTYKTTLTNSWIDIQQITNNWLNTYMTEKQSHKDEVMSFSLKADDVFYILPIYQGQSGMKWNLYLVDNNGEHEIWDKSDNLRYKVDFADHWEEYNYSPNDVEYERRTLHFNSLFTEDPNRSNIDVLVRINAPELKNIPVRGKFLVKIVYKDSENNNQTDWIDVANVLNNDQTHGTNNKKNYNESKGYYEFSASNNAGITNGGWLDLSGGRTGNQVNLTPLIGQSFTSHGKTVTLDAHFNELVFLLQDEYIENNGRYTDPYSHEALDDYKFRFETYSGHHIRVFAKYGYVAPDYTNVVSQNDNNNILYLQGHTINRNHVQSQLIKINNTAISNGEFYFDLKTTALSSGDTGLSKVGESHASNGNPAMMRLITSFSGANPPITISSDAPNQPGLMQQVNAALDASGLSSEKFTDVSQFKYMVLGCEDAKGTKDQGGPDTDWDFNDVVFLIIGRNSLPKVYDKTIEKRYMIEDLGSTYDFDFNDIVVDVKEEHLRNLDHPEKFTFKQTAIIRHLCGTIPFQVKIGDVTIGNGDVMAGHNNGDSEDGFNPTDPAYTWSFEEEGTATSSNATDLESAYTAKRAGKWNPDANNITVNVWPTIRTDGKGENVYYGSIGAASSSDNIKDNDLVNIADIPLEQVEFPKNGLYPYIIATDPRVNWMKEKVSIPDTWLQTKPITDWISPENNGQNPSGNEAKTMNATLGVEILPSFTFSSDADWSYNVRVSADQFAGVTAGSKIVLTISDVVTNPSITLSVPNGNWNTKIGADNYITPSANQTIVEVTIRESDVQNLTNYGIAIQGHGFTLRKVEYIGSREVAYTATDLGVNGLPWSNTSSNTLQLFQNKTLDNNVVGKYLRLYYKIEDKAQLYGLYQLGYGNSSQDWYDNSNKLPTDSGSGYIELYMTKNIVDNINASKPIYINTRNGDDYKGFTLNKVTLVTKL